MIKLAPTNPSLVILHPKTRKRVPMTGVQVDPRDPFWRRRLKEGSMVEVSLDGEDSLTSGVEMSDQPVTPTVDLAHLSGTPEAPIPAAKPLKE